MNPSKIDPERCRASADGVERAVENLGSAAVVEAPGGVKFARWHRPGSNALAVTVTFRDGVNYEGAHQWGYSHFLEHLHFKRSRSHQSFLSIVSSIEEAGGKISAFSTRESITYWVMLPCWHLAKALDILEELLTTASFRLEDVEKEKKLINEEILREKANPRFYNKLYLEELLLAPRGLCRHPLGSRRSLADVTPDELEAYKRESYSLKNMFLSVVGSYEERELLAAIDSFMGAFAPGAARTPVGVLEGFPMRAARRYTLAYAGARQSNLALGWRLPAPTRRERYLWQLLNTLLGVGYSSTLFQRLREEKALTYLVQTGMRFYECGGTFRIDLDLFEENLPSALEEIEAIIESLRAGDLSEESLTRARSMHWGSLLILLEEGLERARWLNHAITSPYLTCDLQEIEEVLQSATLAEIVSLAREHLDFSKAVVTVAGDPEKIARYLGEDMPVLDEF